MEPIFIYFDKVKFDNNDLKTFTIKFSDGDLLDGVFFKKTHDYYITSMISSIMIERNIKELKDHADIKKMSDLSKKFLTGADHYQTFPLISSSVFSELGPDKKLLPDKSKRGSSVVRIDYFDVDTNKKKFVYVYSGYEDLKLNGLTFTNQDVSFKLNLLKENNGLYIEKKVNLLRSETDLLADAIVQANEENVIMVKLGSWYFPVFIPISRYYFKRKATISKQQFDREILTHDFIYRAIFDVHRYQFVITKDKSKISARFPIWIGQNDFTVSAGTALYFTPSLYNKLKRKLTFTGRVLIRDDLLQDIKTKLNNSKTFNTKTFFIFRSRDSNAKYKFNIDEFTIPNDKVIIKSSSDRKQDVFNYISEKKTSMSEKIKAPEGLVEKLESKELTLLKSLTKKVNIKSITYAYENFFLYDLENIIKPTFTTELQKEFNIYGLIYFSGDAKENNKLHLIRPKNRLKFQLNNNIYKKEMRFEIAKVHKKKTFDVVGDYISNFSILRTRKYAIGQKRKTMELVDQLSILGIQNAEFNVLNPIHISITSDAIISKLRLYKNNRFRFVLRSFLFSSNIVNDTDVIIITSNGLSDTKQALIIKDNQSILEKTLGVCFLTEIPEWDIIKGASKRVQVVFSDSEDINQNNNHLAFSFITKNIADLLQFSVTLLDGAGKQITFPADETKLPIISFTIEIIK